MSLLVLSGCVSQTLKPTPEINRVVIINEQSTSIQDVTIWVEKIRGKFYCGVIPAGAQCANTFPTRPYEENDVTLSWQDGQQQRKTVPFSIEVTSPTDTPMTAVLKVTRQGELQATLLPK